MSFQFVNIHVIPLTKRKFKYNTAQDLEKPNVQLANGHTSLIVCMLRAHAAGNAHRVPNFLHNRRTFFTDPFIRLYGYSDLLHPSYYDSNVPETLCFREIYPLFSGRASTPCHISILFPTISPVHFTTLAFRESSFRVLGNGNSDKRG